MYTAAPDTPLFDKFTGPWGVSQPHVQYREGRRCLAGHFVRKGRGPQIYLWEGDLPKLSPKYTGLPYIAYGQLNVAIIALCSLVEPTLNLPLFGGGGRKGSDDSSINDLCHSKIVAHQSDCSIIVNYIPSRLQNVRCSNECEAYGQPCMDKMNTRKVINDA